MKNKGKALIVTNFSFLHLCMAYLAFLPIMYITRYPAGFEKWALVTPWLLLLCALIIFLLGPLGGIIMDKLDITKDPEGIKVIVFVSIALSTIGCALSLYPGCLPCWVIAMITNGVGYALFYVAGAKFVLRSSDKALPGSFYISSGAIGLAGAIGAAKEGNIIPYLMFALILVLCLIYAFLFYNEKIPFPEEVEYSGYGSLPKKKWMMVVILIGFLIASICFLGFYGGEVLPLNSIVEFLIVGLAVFLGQCLGGWLLDRFGPFLVIGLSVTGSFILSFFLSNPFCFLLFATFFHLLPPFALDVLRKCFPGREGLSFGLHSSILFLGYFLAFAVKGCGGQIIAIPVILATMGLLLVSVIFLLKKEKAKKE